MQFYLLRLFVLRKLRDVSTILLNHSNCFYASISLSCIANVHRILDVHDSILVTWSCELGCERYGSYPPLTQATLLCYVL